MYCSAIISNDFIIQLFQVATLLYIKNKYNKKLVYNNQNEFMISSKLFENYDNIKFTNVDYLEMLDILPKDTNVLLNITKFDNFSLFNNDILEQLRFYVYSFENYITEAYNIYCKIKDKFNCNDNDMVSVYIDDCKNIKYYNKAISQMQKKNVVLFVNEPSNNLFNDNNYNVYIICENNIYIKFILLSFFQNNIINYTNPLFSLWAMYISKYDDYKNCILPSYIKSYINFNLNKYYYKFIV